MIRILLKEHWSGHLPGEHVEVEEALADMLVERGYGAIEKTETGLTGLRVEAGGNGLDPQVWGIHPYYASEEQRVLQTHDLVCSLSDEGVASLKALMQASAADELAEVPTSGGDEGGPGEGEPNEEVRPDKAPKAPKAKAAKGAGELANADTAKASDSGGSEPAQGS